MQAAFREARFSEAADIFDKHGKDAPIAPVLLRARLFLKSGDTAGVIRLLAARRASDKRDRAEAQLLLACAHSRMLQFTDADEEFAAATSLAKSAGDKELLAEIAYRKAVRYVQESKNADARREIALAKKAQTRQIQINAAEAESFLLASESRYEEQAKVLAGLLETLNPNSDEFTESRAWATHTLAALARELYIPEGLAIAERHLEAGQWTSDLAINRFQGFKAVGWAHALRGDYFSAFRFLKRSLSIAPGKAWLTIAHADRAYLAKCNAERLWARQELAEAEDLAAQVDWEALRGEELIALLLIAELFADSDPSRAAYYLARFDELGEVRNRLLHFRNDARLKALADYSRAIVELSLGNRKRGITLLRSTQEFFAGIRYEWRAGRCALDLYEVTKDAVHLTQAQELLRNYMGSWLGARLRGYAGQTSLQVRLPRMQQLVFEDICRGFSNAEIAKHLKRSEYTVANHVKSLLKTFNVPSRSALVAEAVRRGLIKREA
jgi:hypothetical protein